VVFALKNKKRRKSVGRQERVNLITYTIYIFHVSIAVFNKFPRAISPEVLCKQISAQ